MTKEPRDPRTDPRAGDCLRRKYHRRYDGQPYWLERTITTVSQSWPFVSFNETSDGENFGGDYCDWSSWQSWARDAEIVRRRET